MRFITNIILSLIYLSLGLGMIFYTQGDLYILGIPLLWIAVTHFIIAIAKHKDGYDWITDGQIGMALIWPFTILILIFVGFLVWIDKCKKYKLCLMV